MITHHPQLDLLTEHAAGALPLAQAACVGAHLNYCESCARTVAQLQQVGAALFAAADAEPVGDAMLDRVLARLDEEPPLQYQPQQAQQGDAGAITAPPARINRDRGVRSVGDNADKIRQGAVIRLDPCKYLCFISLTLYFLLMYSVIMSMPLSSSKSRNDRHRCHR